MHSAKICCSIAVCALALALIGPNPLRAEESLGSRLADPAGASGFVEQLGQQAAVIAAAESRNAQGRHEGLKALVREGFDLPLIGRFVLGRFWRQADGEQRAQFQDLFAEHLVNSYARQLDRYRAETLAVMDSRPVGTKDVLVETRVESTEGPLVTGWRVRGGGDRHRIVDVTVDGISLALTERQQFVSAARKLGLEGLLEAMRANALNRANRTGPAQTMSDPSAKAWMLVSFMGSSGSPLQVGLARQ
ncbi:MAG: ABC transporter substrate-binding protein [Rhodospirillales bacterium]|nr:ABC transporter substrate-binding protein [Rhodospirillales bacterium]